MWFKTSHVAVSESKNKIFVSQIVFLLFTFKVREVILSHPNLQTMTDYLPVERAKHPKSYILRDFDI